MLPLFLSLFYGHLALCLGKSFSPETDKKEELSFTCVPAAQGCPHGCFPQSRFPQVPWRYWLSRRSSALALSFAKLSIGGVWAMMLYGTRTTLRYSSAVLQTGAVEYSTTLPTSLRGCSSDGTLAALLRPVAPFTLALICSVLCRFFGRWYFTHQRSSSGAVDRVDDVPCSLAVILYPSGSPSTPS